MTHCRCSLCRQQQGAPPKAAFVTLSLAAFRWTSGEDAITNFQSPTHGARAFCKHCGSLTPQVESDTGLVICPASSLEGHLTGPDPRHI